MKWDSFVFFDLDGLAADFVGGALAIHGLHIPPADVQWDFMTQVGFSASDPKFWEPLANEKFWAGLQPLADGMALISGIESEMPVRRLGILSSGLVAGSCDGKRKWLAQHLPAFLGRINFCSVKEMCASSRHILVDDHDGNVDKFIAAGGRAVLVPRPWNNRRNETDAEGRFDVAKVMDEVLDAAGV